MPARATLSPGTFPIVVTIFVATAFPKRKISHAVLLVFVVSHGTGRAITKLALIKTGETPIVIEARNLVIHGTVLTAVGVPLPHQFLDHLDLVRDVLHRTWLEMRRQIVECFTVFVETCLLYTSPSPRDLSTSRMPSSA